MSHDTVEPSASITLTPALEREPIGLVYLADQVDDHGQYVPSPSAMVYVLGPTGESRPLAFAPAGGINVVHGPVGTAPAYIAEPHPQCLAPCCWRARP